MSDMGQTLTQVKKRLRALGASRGQLAKPEIKQLPHLLLSDEIIEAFMLGWYEGGYGMLLATNLRLVFIDVMPFGRLIIDDIPYTMIASVELQLGLLLGSVTVYGRSKNYKFWWVDKQNARTFSGYIEAKLLEYQKNPNDR